LNPRLIALLFVSVLVGVLAAVATLIAGWGVLAALAAYCVGGALSLTVLSILAVSLPRRKPQPAPRSLHV